jgi:uncharacterized protein
MVFSFTRQEPLAMTLSISQTVKTTVRRNLTVLDSLLDKAAAFATAKSFDVGVLLGSRIAPDMFPLTRQIQIACDMAKAWPAVSQGRPCPCSRTWKPRCPS